MNKNTYPLHIEKQFERVYKNAIKRLGRIVLPQIKGQFNKQKEKEQQFDADNFNELENELNESFQEQVLESGFIESQIKNVAILLDRWALAKTNQSINKIKMATKKNARSFIPVVIEKENPFVDDYIESYTRFNVQLVEQLGHEYIPEVSQLAQKAFNEGRSTAELAKQLKEFTEGKLNKATFWAQDQAGDAFTAFTKIRQTQAGFPGYIWHTTGDNRVRPSHELLNNRFFTWAKGAPGLTKPGAKHPGQDYRCRCSAEPTFNDQGI
jgi:SPP1 gp7 family putative phage head morphogenesis protein